MTPDQLRAFAAVTHELATERDAERADHAETRKLARNLEDDLRRTKALLVESETVRRGMGGELAALRSLGPNGPATDDVLGEVVADLQQDARALRAGQFTPEALAGQLENAARRVEVVRDRIEANT